MHSVSSSGHKKPETLLSFFSFAPASPSSTDQRWQHDRNRGQAHWRNIGMMRATRRVQEIESLGTVHPSRRWRLSNPAEDFEV